MSGKKRSGAPAPGIFISFSDVAESFSSPLASSDGPTGAPALSGPEAPWPGPGSAARCDEVVVDVPYYSGSHPEVAQLTRTITKKDGITRVKALRELRSVVEGSGTAGIDQLVPFFVSLHRKLSLDTSRAVREEVNMLLCALMRSCKKEFTPTLMRALIGRWWMCMSDPCREVIAAATRAFEEAIPPKKRESVLASLAPAILDFVRSVLNSTPESLSAQETMFKGCSAEDAAERYHNVVSSCMRALTRLITPCPASSPADLTDKPASVSEDKESHSVIRGYLTTSSIRTLLDSQVSAELSSQFNPKMLTLPAQLFFANMWRRSLNMSEAYLRSCVYEFIDSYASMHPEPFRTAMGLAPSAVDSGSASSSGGAAGVVVALLATESHKILVRIVRKEAEAPEATEASVAAVLKAGISISRTCPDLVELHSPNELFTSIKRCFEKFPEIGSFFLLRLLDVFPAPLKRPGSKEESSVFPSLLDILSFATSRPSASIDAQVSVSEIAAYLLLQIRGSSILPDSDAFKQASDACSALINLLKIMLPRYICSTLGRNSDHSTDRRVTKGDTTGSDKLSGALSRCLVVVQLLSVEVGLTCIPWEELFWNPFSAAIADCIDSSIKSQSYNPSEIALISRSVWDLLRSSLQRSGVSADGVGIARVRARLRDHAVALLACPPSAWPSDSATLVRLFWAADLLTVCSDVFGSSADKTLRFPLRTDWLSWLLDLVEEEPAWTVFNDGTIEIRRISSTTPANTAKWSPCVSTLIKGLGAYACRSRSDDDITILFTSTLRCGKAGLVASLCRGWIECTTEHGSSFNWKAIGTLAQDVLSAIFKTYDIILPELADTIASLLLVLGIDYPSYDEKSCFAELCRTLTTSKDWFHQYTMIRFFCLCPIHLATDLPRASALLDKAMLEGRDGPPDNGFNGVGLALLARGVALNPGRPDEAGSLDVLKPLLSSHWSPCPEFNLYLARMLYASIYSAIWTASNLSLSHSICAALMINVLSLENFRTNKSSAVLRDEDMSYLHVFGCDDISVWQELTSFARNDSVLSDYRGFTAQINKFRHTVQSLLAISSGIPTPEALFPSNRKLVEFVHAICGCLSDLISLGKDCNARKYGWNIEDTFVAMHSIRCSAVELRKLAHGVMGIGFREISTEGGVDSQSFTESKVVSELVQALSIKADDVAIECLLADAIILRICSAQANKESESIHLDSPIPGDVLKPPHDADSSDWRGKEVTVVHTITTDASHEPMATRVRMQSGSIIATHMDDGPDAPHYYTVRVDDREVQVEGHKIVLQPLHGLVLHPKMSSFSALETKIPIAPSPHRACEVLLESFRSSKNADGLSALAEGLVTSIQQLLSMCGLNEPGDPKAAFTTTRDKVPLLDSAATTASALIRVFGAAFDMAEAVIRERKLFIDVLSVVRGTIIKLMSCGFTGPASMPNPNGWVRFVAYFRIALKLLNSLLLSSWGFGAGISNEDSFLVRGTFWLIFLQPGFYNVVAALSTLPRLVFSTAEKAFLLGELTCATSLLVNKQPHPLRCMHKHGNSSGLGLTYHEWSIFAVDSAPSPLSWNFSQLWLLPKVLELNCPMRRSALASELEVFPDCCGDGYCVLWNEMYGTKEHMHDLAFMECLSRLWERKGSAKPSAVDAKVLNNNVVAAKRLDAFDSAPRSWELDGLAYILRAFVKMASKFTAICDRDEQEDALASLNSQFHQHVVHSMDCWFQSCAGRDANDRFVRLHKLIRATNVMEDEGGEQALLDLLSVSLKPSIFSFPHSKHLECTFVSCGFVATKLLNVWYSDAHSLFQQPSEVIAPPPSEPSSKQSRFEALVGLLSSHDDEDDEAEEALEGGDVSAPTGQNLSAASSWLSDVLGWINPLSQVSRDEAGARGAASGRQDDDGDDDFAVRSAQHGAREMARRSAHVTMLAQLVGPRFLRELCRSAAMSDAITEDPTAAYDDAGEVSTVSSPSDLIMSANYHERGARRRHQMRFEYLVEDDVAALRALMCTLRWFVLLSRVGGLSSSGWRCSDSNDEARLREAVFSQKGTLVDVCANIHDFCIAAIGEFETNLLPCLSRSYFIPAIRLEGRTKSLSSRVSHGVWKGVDGGVLGLSACEITSFHADGYDAIEARESSLRVLLASALVETVVVAPSLIRSFYDSSSNRAERGLLKDFIEKNVTASLIAHEVDSVNRATTAGKWAAAVAESSGSSSSSSLDSGDLKVVASRASGETVAVYTRDETSIEMRITLPPGYPLRNVEVTCTGRLGDGGRWQRWVLQIVHLMSQRDGSVVDAVLLWRRNVDKEFEGAEPCPICYSTLHAKSLCLPSVECSTCHNKFHPTCLYTWFQSSGKSKCVMCQQPFVFSHRRK